MAQQTVDNGDSGLVARTKINENFTETYSKQDALVSGTNIKTINGADVLGSGDLTVSGGVTHPQAMARISLGL